MTVPVVFRFVCVTRLSVINEAAELPQDLTNR